MLSVRTLQADELPGVLQRAVQTASAQLAPRDVSNASLPGVTAMVQRMYQMALGTPGGTVLVVDWPSGYGADGLAAYTLLMPQPNPFTGAAEVVVLDIFTDPRLRGRGVGRMLLGSAAQYARSIGCGGLVAQVALSNQASMRMLLGDGFQSERLVLGRPV